MVVYNIRRTLACTCYGIVFVCVSTHCLFRIIYTSRRGNVRGMSKSIQGRIQDKIPLDKIPAYKPPLLLEKYRNS